MITVVSRWEPDPQIADVELRFWGQLKAFGIDRMVFVPTRDEYNNRDIDQYDSMDKALESTRGNRVFLESTGYKTMNDLPPRHEDVVFVLGCSPTSNMTYAKVNETYRIHEPAVTDMYPTCAASIALAYLVRAMSVDNRTEINDCEDDNVDFSTTGGALGTNTATGNLIENVGSVQFLHSNVYDHTYTVDDSGGTLLSINMTDVTYYILVKANGWSTYSVAAQNLVLGDGTDEIGYATGGSDATGVPIQKQFYAIKLDCSDAAANPGAADVGHHVYAGVEANLDFTTITLVGYGSLHSAKAQGNVANSWIDAMSYIANDSYALTINGGTSGTHETTPDVVSDDEGGLLTGLGFGGLITNPAGSLFYFVGPTEWGNSAATADTYYDAIDEQWYWVGDNLGGRAIGATHFPFRIVGNGTDTTDITWTNLVIVNTGTRAEFIAGDTDCDIDWDNVSLTDVGTISFPIAAVSRTHDTVTFANCDQVTPNTCNGTDWTFNGSFAADGAMLLDTDGDGENIAGIAFTSDGTGHAIEISVAGTYDFDAHSYTGYAATDGSTGDEVVYISVNAAVTINVQNNGETPTIRDSGTAPTINNAVTVAVDGVAEGTSCKVIADETAGTITSGDTIFELLADSTGTAQITDFNYEGAFGAGLDVLVRARNQGLANAAIADDNGSYTDETTESNTATDGDMQLLPVTPVSGEDRYIFGHSEEFNRLKVNVSTAGTGGFTITWQYWNGAWTTLSGVTDGTNSFSTLGSNIVSFTAPGDMATTTINGQGPFYFVRAAYTAGTVTITPLGRGATLDVTRYLPIPPTGELVRTITSDGLTATLSQAVDSIAKFDPLND